MAVLSSVEPDKTLLRKRGVRLNKHDLIWFIPFLSAAIFPVFWQLTSFPILQWDEARLAVNAAEMVENGNLLVTYFQGQPDMWNTKPPFHIWLLALSVKIFGYTEFAIRFPSVMAVLGTFALLFWFGLRIIKSKTVAALSVLVLVSSSGYMGYHVGRNGDYEAVLIFFITLYTLTFFLYLENGQRKFWWWCVAGLILAALTKGVAGLLCAPALLVYVLYRRQLTIILKQRSFYLGVAIFLFFTLGYYLLREQLNPGYLQAVYKNELGGRYSDTLEGHLHPWSWYLEIMRDYKYGYWFYFVPAAMWILCWQHKPVVKRFTVYGALFLAIFLIIISSAQTKLYWYEAPVYPICALLVALAIHFIIGLRKYLGLKRSLAFTVFTVVLVCCQPYYEVLQNYLIKRATFPKENWDSMFGPVLKKMAERYPEEKQISFFQEGYQYRAVAHFYKMAYTKKGYNINEIDKKKLEQVKPNQLVLVVSSELTGYLEKRFETKTLMAEHNARVYRIIAKK